MEGGFALGQELARQGIGLVYGGASVGVMGAVADGALSLGGEVIGVIPRSLALKEIFHENLSALHVVSSMHERKAMMADLADGFIALPGGFGTFDELCEILTWAQLGIHRKPMGLLDIDGFFAPLLALFEQTLREGFISQAHLDMIEVGADASALLAQLREARLPQFPKWMEASQT